jgi:hypothetical protein
MIKMLSFLLLFPNMINIYLSKWGRDERLQSDTDIDYELLQKIKINLIRKHILETLLDDNVDDFSKMNIIENLNSNIYSNINNCYANDLKAGDLYKVFDFQFEDE